MRILRVSLRSRLSIPPFSDDGCLGDACEVSAPSRLDCAGRASGLHYEGFPRIGGSASPVSWQALMFCSSRLRLPPARLPPKEDTARTVCVRECSHL